MGLFDLLSKEGRAKSALERAKKKVMNKHMQSPDRFGAMEKLRDIGTEEALYGLAKRFSYVYDKGIEDEQEKEWVESTLVAAGETAIPAVRRFMLESETVSYPLRILEKIASKERLLAILDELCAKEEPGYTRDPQRKIQFLTWLGEWKDAGTVDVSQRVVPYLADFDENVRFIAVDSLSHHKHESAREPLLDALLRPEEESRRIKVRIAEVLAEAGWKVTDRKDQVAQLIGSTLPEFGMQHDKLVKKREK